MLYWYQKEYASGELYQALWDIAFICPSGLFETAFTKIKKVEADSDVLESMLHQLTCLVVSASCESNLIVKQGGFTLKEKAGQSCSCRKTGGGWIFEIEGFDNATVSLGWQKVSYEHPLSGTTIVVGPSQHLSFFRDDRLK